MNDLSDGSGYTLLETVISLGIFMVVMFAASNILIYATKISGRIAVKHEIFENARIALDVIDSKIKSAEALSLSADNDGSLKKLKLLIPEIVSGREVVSEREFAFFKTSITKYHRIDFGSNELASYIGDVKVWIDDDLLTISILTDDRLSDNASIIVRPLEIRKKISIKGKKKY